MTVVALTIAAQVSVSILVRTHRVHGYLVAQLEHSFGRSVQVRHFNVLLLPTPTLDADRITIGEDPGFGREYFLRAENLSAGLRWFGLLRGHFEFGTLSLTRPSLILVRNQDGRWNLEQWLPPAKSSGAQSARIYGPQSPVAPANHLQKIDFDDGRINFKLRDEKLAFAFTGVSGSVEQVSPGRWQLNLAAQPWRSGASLQSTGTVVVSADLAGTSARLQPAEIRVHWEQASLADLFRLFQGRDYGVRGTFALDGTAKSGAVGSSPQTPPGDWSFHLQARATQIHRWDLTERPDNPRVSTNVSGHWNVLSANVTADQVVIETLKSNLRGSALITNSPASSFDVRFDSTGLQASDALAWYRAFHPGIDDTVTADQFFTGAVRFHGWPLELSDAAFSSAGGEVRIPSLPAPIRIASVHGGRDRTSLTVDPFRISYRPPARSENSAATATAAVAAKRGVPADSTIQANLSFTHDFENHSGAVRIAGHAENAETILKIASALGRPLNHGWELTGAASADLRWDWNANDLPFRGRWNGQVDVAKAELHAAGLNQPLQLKGTRLQWQDNARTADLGEIDGFGATWSGAISAPPPALSADSDEPAKWNFKLHADRLDASELDRWVGPRSRPNWLQRLLPSLLGGSAPTSAASELLRRVNAQGELTIDEFTMEAIKLAQVRVQGALHDLHVAIDDSEAQWAGGKIHVIAAAKFLPRPSYDVTTDVDRVDLAQLPAALHLADRLAGSASGTLHLTTEGVGRDDLFRKLTGKGDVRLHNIEFRGWDLGATIAEGAPRTGVSRWPAGQSTFAVHDGTVSLNVLRLDATGQSTLVKGSITFAQRADLTLQTVNDGKRDRDAPATGQILKISGSLEAPRVSIEKPAARQPAD